MCDTKEEAFYKNGLNFECLQDCTACCAEEPGAVFLTEDDLKAIAKEVNLSVEDTITVYTRKIELEDGKKYLVLKEYSNNECIFLKSYGCSIYKSRPVQCSTYPFWQRILESKEHWDNEQAFCKGINSAHSKVGFEKIKAELKKYEDSKQNYICFED